MWIWVNAFIRSRSIFGSSSTTIVTTASPSRAHCRRNVGEASHIRRTSGPSSLETARGDVNPGAAGRQPVAIVGGAPRALGFRTPRYASPAPRVTSGCPAVGIDWPAATAPGSHTAKNAAEDHARRTANRRTTDRFAAIHKTSSEVAIPLSRLLDVVASVALLLLKRTIHRQRTVRRVLESQGCGRGRSGFCQASMERAR